MTLLYRHEIIIILMLKITTSAYPLKNSLRCAQSPVIDYSNHGNLGNGVSFKMESGRAVARGNHPLECLV